MELSPEERRQIYEEERAKAEDRVPEIAQTGDHGPGRIGTLLAALLISAPFAIGGYQWWGDRRAAERAHQEAYEHDIQHAQDMEMARAARASIDDQLSVRPLAGWTWNGDDNGYDYIRGSIKNYGSRPTSYWKIRVDFTDSKGAVIDSGFTNSIDRLNPGSSARFEIMHSHPSGAKKASVAMEEVRFEGD